MGDGCISVVNSYHSCYTTLKIMNLCSTPGGQLLSWLLLNSRGYSESSTCTWGQLLSWLLLNHKRDGSVRPEIRLVNSYHGCYSTNPLSSLDYAEYGQLLSWLLLNGPFQRDRERIWAGQLLSWLLLNLTSTWSQGGRVKVNFYHSCYSTSITTKDISRNPRVNSYHGCYSTNGKKKYQFSNASRSTLIMAVTQPTL